jgi:hypothetical protein
MEYKSSLDEIVAILKYHNEIEVEMLFGCAWGNEYKDWTPFIISSEFIMNEIDKAEKTGTGSFYDDDTFLYLDDIGTEILFCHEHDIHLSYNETNELVTNILDAWEAKGIIQEKRIKE